MKVEGYTAQPSTSAMKGTTAGKGTSANHVPPVDRGTVLIWCAKVCKRIGKQ